MSSAVTSQGDHVLRHPAYRALLIGHTVNYLGNVIRNVWYSNQINPAVYGPGATTANTNQRRVLFRQNPAEGQYFASVQEVRPDGTSNYHALLLQTQRRRANGLSLQAERPSATVASTAGIQ